MYAQRRGAPIRKCAPSTYNGTPVRFSATARPGFGRAESRRYHSQAPSPTAKSLRVPISAAGLTPTNSEPTQEVLDIWHKAEAVCFDVDCTITVNDSLDLLAEFMGVGDKCSELTNKAMDGTMNLEEALGERLEIINCKPDDVKRFIKAHPPATRLTPGIEKVIKGLQARNITIYLISGSFREMILPVARHLGIPTNNVIANRMLWQWDDETMEPTKLVGLDLSEPTAHNEGKPQAISQIRERFPYNSVIMIGDGITDLEAVQVSGGADLFIGYGGIVQQPLVMAEADWFIYDWDVLAANLKRWKVAMIGSGAWACAAVGMVAHNTVRGDQMDLYDDSVSMWTYEEEVDGRKLTELINERHENPKYLPGVDLGANVVADPDLLSAVRGADILIFCAPHQFIRGICKQLVGHVKPSSFAISLTKGMRVRPDGPQLISQMVTRYLNIDCSVLMGANVASGIAAMELSEAVIGYTNLEHANRFKDLFERPYFRVSLVADVAGAEMCGTLKNVIALAAGMIDGLGYGANSKAAILREGLDEMRRFSKALYPSIRDDTFLESCGVADLIATCYGGRNRLVAMEWTKSRVAGQMTSFAELEAKLLNGQKLQGVLTSNEVQEILKSKGWEQSYPLFTTINCIINGELDPIEITEYFYAVNKAKEVLKEVTPKTMEKSDGPKYGPVTIDLDA